jgi:hypothetical protein
MARGLNTFVIVTSAFALGLPWGGVCDVENVRSYMKKVVTTIAVVLFSTTMWVGCSKDDKSGGSGGGGGGGITHSNVQAAVQACLNTYSRWANGGTQCAQVRSGRCPSLMDYVQDPTLGGLFNPASLPPEAQDQQRYYYMLNQDFMGGLQYMAPYWAQIVNRDCSVADRTNILNGINGLINQAQGGLFSGTTAPGYGNTGYGPGWNSGYGSGYNTGYGNPYNSGYNNGYYGYGW